MKSWKFDEKIEKNFVIKDEKFDKKMWRIFNAKFWEILRKIQRKVPEFDKWKGQLFGHHNRSESDSDHEDGALEEWVYL